MEETVTRSVAAPRDERARQVWATLERGLSRHFGERVRIEALQSVFHARSTSYRSERLRVRMSDGRALPVFFKDLSPESLLRVARKVRMPVLGSSRVEWRMYRDLLAPEHDGTPRLYASRRGPGRGLCWLFLEDIGNMELRYAGEPAYWLAAARWAARFHASTRHLSRAELRAIPRHGEAHFRRWALEVERRSAVLGPAERTIVGRALDTYSDLVPRLAGLPVSLVHGQYFGRNILLRSGPAARAVAVVDWESAALGPSYLDIVSLTCGKWSPSRKLAMRRAYLDEYRSATGKRLRWETFARSLRDLELYHALLFLTPTLQPGAIRTLVAKRRPWIEELERLERERARRVG
jgi:hypothetical protein